MVNSLKVLSQLITLFLMQRVQTV